MALMILLITRKQLSWFYGLVFLSATFFITNPIIHLTLPLKPLLAENEVLSLLNQLFHLRNQALLEHNLRALNSLYDQHSRTGIWAYEQQIRRMRCLHQWNQKQGTELTAVRSLIRLRRIKPITGGIRVTLMVSTEYHYIYQNNPAAPNRMRLGTYHSLDIGQRKNLWKITREWYTDPFAEAIQHSTHPNPTERAFILSQPSRNFQNLNPLRKKAVAYADTYSGAAANEEKGFKYNSKYKNYNYSGGDCANFVSQVLHEGGGFQKNSIWNYEKEASRAWVNAQAFHNYMINSGRGTKLAHGTYDQVFHSSYQLLPGDYIAYEKRGKITHVSIVTGADSNGYTLTNSHNADRYRVPWDLGYSAKQIRFWLVRVNY